MVNRGEGGAESRGTHLGQGRVTQRIRRYRFSISLSSRTIDLFLSVGSDIKNNKNIISHRSSFKAVKPLSVLGHYVTQDGVWRGNSLQVGRLPQQQYVLKTAKLSSFYGSSKYFCSK